MALDDATITFLAGLAEAGGPPLHEQTPDEARALGPALRELYGSGPEMVRTSDTDVATPDGSTFTVRTLVPTAEPAAVIVYYHGGGWVLGDIDDYDTLGRLLAARTGAAVVLVDYRLAPEHRYPTAAEDAWTALTWVDAHLEEIAGKRVPLIVAGDSAGGNLSAVVAQRARAAGPAIGLQVLVYPVTDADLDTTTYADPANQLMLSRDTMIWFWDHYAPDPADRRKPDASPLRAADLSGLPPAVVLLAEHDVLRAEGEAYAAALRAAGVPVELRVLDGQMHAFFQLVNVLPGAADGLEFVSGHIEKFLAS
ncbi:alpha/beta hydrolase [Pseudonocardia sp. GCM10023141]|uniref:alpha/beta hydrolase n=1 Tax=Pseudonocardia sp. GCM10023141 TaxID=3252653 RepID=UPI00361B3A47